MNQKNNSTATTSSSSSSSSTTTETKLATWQHMYAAWEGGSITCLFTNPLWLIKTRMQLQSKASTTSTTNVSPYRGISDAFITIIKNEGIIGLYRGLLPALFLTSHGMVQFGVYEKCKDTFIIPKENPQIASMYYFAFGAISKAAAVMATYPYQVIKARMQQRFIEEEKYYQSSSSTTSSSSSTGSKPTTTNAYRGMISTIKYIWQQEGGIGYYKGFMANLLRVAPQSAITLVAYEQIKLILDSYSK